MDSGCFFIQTFIDAFVVFVKMSNFSQFFLIFLIKLLQMLLQMQCELSYLIIQSFAVQTRKYLESKKLHYIC